MCESRHELKELLPTQSDWYQANGVSFKASISADPLNYDGCRSLGSYLFRNCCKGQCLAPPALPVSLESTNARYLPPRLIAPRALYAPTVAPLPSPCCPLYADRTCDAISFWPSLTTLRRRDHFAVTTVPRLGSIAVSPSLRFDSTFRSKARARERSPLISCATLLDRRDAARRAPVFRKLEARLARLFIRCLRGGGIDYSLGAR